MKANHEEMKKRVERISKATQLEDGLHLKDGEIAKFTLKSASDVPQTSRPHSQIRPEVRVNPSTTTTYQSHQSHNANHGHK